MIQSVAFHTPSDATMAPDLLAEQAEARRKQAIMEAMMQQQMQSQGQQPPNHGRMSILNPIAQAFSGYMAGKANQDAGQSAQDLARRSQEQTMAAMDQYKAQTEGTPGTVPDSGMGFDEVGGTPPDPQGAIRNAMISKHPLMRHVAERDFAAEATRKQHERDIAARAAEQREALRLQKELKVDESIPENWAKHLPKGTKPGQMPGTFAGTDGDLMQMQFKDGKYVGARNVNTLPKPPVHNTINQPAVTIAKIVDPKNPRRMIEVDARTYREDKYLKGDNTGVIGESGKESAKQEREAKRAFTMSGIGGTLTAARNILEGKGGTPLPTGSGAGTFYDYAASLVGYSPTGAKEADAMRVIGGALTAKMPRMEGPQSDRDTVLYKEMAGRVGDSNIPIDRRLRAMEEIERLWAKYEHLNPGVFAGTEASPAGGGGAVERWERGPDGKLRKVSG